MKVEVFESITQIPESAWTQISPSSFPFMAYQFLHALETTDCLGSRTGWAPVYLTVWDEKILQGAMIFYIKNNSYGEYIFDFAWAHAHESYGRTYYPKLVAAVPFTPATGPKILLDSTISSESAKQVSAVLLDSAKKLQEKFALSSLHLLFVPDSELETYRRAGLFIRHSFQYHWRNQNYRSFEDFLSGLRAKRRKEILRERSQVKGSQVKIERLTGDQIKAQHADLFYRFYLDTVQKRGGHDYLTPAFFREIFRTMKDQILFVLAYDVTGRPVAGALNYFSAGALYGRHWGCLDEYKALHFEVCYYQGIEFCIERGIELFEAGAQGEHKFQRGFLPCLTYSAHEIKDPQLAIAIMNFVETEKAQIQELFDEYAEHTPFNREQALSLPSNI